ncbi:MerC mercury resistance protein [Roseivirga ehrenbergii]|uniref:MerC mercury resistance protein n=1 Tax=Roseivirga ehrenbergii (strain DSM 102268 / JCM 13514 / KCTC 12282 / NCIMB 14502 / KMM 6017) TaxID=279360 RepID=A0A150X7U1_ROSEK|nr:MerC domain-containing protein [Roseivirga ehrenbergii]KYG74807.1 hypothetical protein MB14_06275 [Roseivirga ehrenbergii]TCL13860.1 MerC mercury resistance protein [Roseivirga ehrenbergii]
MNLFERTIKPDVAGVLAGSLCAVHCLATPFIFLAKAGSSLGHVESPLWYHLFDYVFIIISFVAVFYASKNTAKRWVKTALWSVWSILLMAILNEAFELIHLPEASVYIPALLLAALHLYNRKYCQCADNNCCAIN